MIKRYIPKKSGIIKALKIERPNINDLEKYLEMLKEEFGILYPGIFFNETDFRITLDDRENSVNRNYVDIGDYITITEDSDINICNVDSYTADELLEYFDEM
jgi:hypothetical protein